MSVAPPSSLGRTLDFMRVLWAIQHALQAASKRMDVTLGVTGPQRVALRIIVRSPGLSAKHLARTLRLHASTVTGVLTRLEARKLIFRRSDPADGRGIRLFATKAGRALTRSSKGTVEADVSRALQRMSSRDLTAARRALAILAHALGDT